MHIHACINACVFRPFSQIYMHIYLYPRSYSVRDYFVEIRVSAGKTCIFKDYVRFLFVCLFIYRCYYIFRFSKNKKSTGRQKMFTRFEVDVKPNEKSRNFDSTLFQIVPTVFRSFEKETKIIKRDRNRCLLLKRKYAGADRRVEIWTEISSSIETDG